MFLTGAPFSSKEADTKIAHSGSVDNGSPDNILSLFLRSAAWTGNRLLPYGGHRINDNFFTIQPPHGGGI